MSSFLHTWTALPVVENSDVFPGFAGLFPQQALVAVGPAVGATDQVHLIRADVAAPTFRLSLRVHLANLRRLAGETFTRIYM